MTVTPIVAVLEPSAFVAVIVTMYVPGTVNSVVERVLQSRVGRTVVEVPQPARRAAARRVAEDDGEGSGAAQR